MSSTRLDFEQAGEIGFTVGERVQTAGRAWYRGEHCNFNPALANMRAHDAIQRHILAGWLPASPLIGPDTRVTTFGSCFADNISRYLNARNYNVLNRSHANAYVVTIGEGLVNSFALRQQFDWAFYNRVPQQDLWHGWSAESYGVDETVRQSTLQLFMQTDVFILTLGLSEIWYDEPTGEVFWRAVPERLVDPSRHKFRVSTVEENKQNLLAIYRAIREFRPDARIIVTLSPIPLVATFRPVSSLTANAASKAILRVAIDEVYNEVGSEGVLHYWPSYEIVQEGFGQGRWYDDRRHISSAVIYHIMRLFEEFYCHGGAPRQSVLQTLAAARTATGELERDVLAAIASSDLGAIETILERSLQTDDREGAEFIARLALEALPGHAALANRLAAIESLPARPLMDRQVFNDEMDALLRA